jgi:hypothetical protein
MLKGLGKAIDTLVYIAVIGIVAIFALILYIFYDKTGTKVIKSKIAVKPKIELVTDGTKIDTVYIYTFK